VPLLPISFLEGEPRDVQADMLALGVDEFHLPRLISRQSQHRPQYLGCRHCHSPIIREIKIPCTVYISLKLGMYVVLQSHEIPVTSFYVNSEFYNVTVGLRFASFNVWLGGFVRTSCMNRNLLIIRNFKVCSLPLIDGISLSPPPPYYYYYYYYYY